MKKSIILIAIVSIIALTCACSNTKAKSDAGEELRTSQVEEQKHTRTLPDGAIAFDYVNHLYFDVIVQDSIPARMIFDTGNTNILLDTEFYKQYFAPSDNLQRIVIQGAGNSLQGAYKDVSDWRYTIGQHSHTEQGAIVMNLRNILGNEVDGMYGMEFMRGRKVEFNYTDEYMRILTQDEQPSDGYTCVKCKWLDDRHSRMLLPISVKFDNKASFEGDFLVDMGSSTGILLNGNVAAQLNLKSVLINAKKMTYDTAGVGGAGTDYIFKAKSTSIAGVEIKNMRTSYSGNTKGSLVDNRYAGIVGNGLFERFDVIFDFNKCEIWLRPNENIDTPTNHHSGTVLTPQEDCWVVNGLIEGGNAHKAGLKRGDTIISINELSRKEIDSKKLKKLHSSAEAWTVVVKRGDSTAEIKFEKELM